MNQAKRAVSVEREMSMSRRGECIYKRKDGRWEARYVKEILMDGTKKYGSVYAKSYKEVKEKQQQKIFKPTVVVTQATYNTTLSVAADIWLQSVKNQIKKSSWQKYQSLIENHVKGVIGDMPLKFITAKTVEQFTDAQLNYGKFDGSALSRKTVNDILIVLGMIFDYAYESFEIVMPKIKLLRENKNETRVLDKNEQSKLLNTLYCDMDIYKFGILLSLYTGLRIGELCALYWSDIKDDFIIVSKTMQRLKDDGGGTKIFINPPKSNCSKRIIPLPEFLKPVINHFRQPDGFVLCSNTKSYVEPRLMQIKFEKIITKTGIEKANFHSLRHTFATRCIESGFDIKSLSEILGHSDVKTTLNRYVHSSFEFKQKNMQKLSLPQNLAI